jgi:phosphoglycerate dehydrogenase-like enzyme
MDPFRIGVSRDFLDSEGRLTYRDIGLSLLENETGVRHRFLEALRSPVTPDQIADLDAAFSLTPVWNASSLEGNDRLLVVARFGVGYDNIDVPALSDANVLLTITPGVTDQPVAGGVLAMMLALSRRLFVKDRLVREGRWHERNRYQGTEIGGKVLGIVGFGGAGRQLRRLVAPFKMEVIVHDPFVSDEVLAEHGVERSAGIEGLFERSDYIAVHCLLTEETRGLVNRSLLRRMKPEAYFLNAARGPIVIEADLIEALQQGWIAGAGLDVFEEEPPSLDNPLLKMENVLLAPHAVCWTHECFQAIGETAIRSILSLSRGERPFGMVNPEVFERPGFRDKLSRMLARRSSP